MEKHSFETYVDEDAMYVEPLEISPAVAGGQTEDGNIGMDAEIEVDEAEVFIFTCFSQNCITLSRPGGGNSIRKRPKGHITHP